MLIPSSFHHSSTIFSLFSHHPFTIHLPTILPPSSYHSFTIHLPTILSPSIFPPSSHHPLTILSPSILPPSSHHPSSHHLPPFFYQESPLVEPTVARCPPGPVHAGCQRHLGTSYNRCLLDFLIDSKTYGYQFNSI